MSEFPFNSFYFIHKKIKETYDVLSPEEKTAKDAVTIYSSGSLAPAFLEELFFV